MKGRPMDVLLLWAVLCLMGLGVVMVYSASSVNAAAKLGDADYYLKRQAAFAIAGLVAIYAGSLVPPHLWRSLAVPLLVGAFVALVMVKIPGLGRSGGGAQRWLGVGAFVFQPSELAKFAIINFLAYSLHKKAGRIHEFKYGVMPHILVVGGASVLLLLQPDFGTSVVLVLLTGLLMLLAGVRWRYLFGALLVAVPAAIVLVTQSEYRMRRILAFMDPWAHRKTIGYQVAESLISFGSGGISGLGLGAGKQKLFFLPAAHTDFIFAIIGEELGLLGVIMTVSLFAIIAWRGLRAFGKLGHTAEGYLCAGLTLLVVLQASINMAVVLGLVPTKGLTLPFVSYGGSSLVAMCFMAGVLMRLCADGVEPALARNAVFFNGLRAAIGVRA